MLKKLREIKKSTIFLILALIPIVYLLAGRLYLNYQNKVKLSDYLDNFNKIDLSLKKEYEEENKKLLEGEFGTGSTEVQFNNEQQSWDIKVDTLAKDPIGAIYIPSLGISYPIYYGTDPWVLDNGVGIMEKTSYPGGKGTNSVLTAHRGTQNGEFFRHLDKLEDGDEVYILFAGDVLKYVVDGSDVIKPDDGSKLTLDQNKDKITMLTCTPYLINTERLLVYAYRDTIMPTEAEYVLSYLNSVEKPGYIRFDNLDEDNSIKNVEKIKKPLTTREKIVHLFKKILNK